MKDTPATRGRRQSLPPAVMDTGGAGVMTVPPPPQFLHEIRESVEVFAEAALKPGEHGGLFSVLTKTTDAFGRPRTAANLAVVQRIGGQSLVVGWVGKKWGEPIEGGIGLKLLW